MPAYNAMPYLDEAIASIAGQTFSDFELIILDDGSTDGTLECLRSWAARDRRIRLLESAERSGPVASSNRVVREARAALVARMDADDLADPDRLKLQAEALSRDPGAVLVASLADTIDQDGRLVRPADYGRLFRVSPFAPFPHPSILFRRDAFDRSGGYREQARRWEDVDLYRRMAGLGRILVLTRPLVSVRLSEASTRLAERPEALEASMDAMYRTLKSAQPESRAGLLPDAFLPGAAMRVWTGQRPRLFRRLLKRAALGPDLQSVRMLVWAGWADVNPRGLRLALKTILAVRNRIATRRLRGRAVIEWRPPQDSRSGP